MRAVERRSGPEVSSEPQKILEQEEFGSRAKRKRERCRPNDSIFLQSVSHLSHNYWYTRNRDNGEEKCQNRGDDNTTPFCLMIALPEVGKYPSNRHSLTPRVFNSLVFGTVASENLAARDEDFPVSFLWQTRRKGDFWEEVLWRPNEMSERLILHHPKLKYSI